ncbi:MAG TPA: hypothetical protein VFK22_04630 [Candidatus Dormibacteraeota bacterium]|nr:hypothetical protein [Candidatus Dormibacteraeota bacterium]
MESIAPDSGRIRPLMWLFAGMAAIGGVLTVFLLAKGAWSNLHGSNALAYGLLMLCLGLLGFGYFRLWLAKFRLLVGPDQFGYQDAFGRRHIWYGSQVGEIVDAVVIYNKSSPPRRAIYFVGINGRTTWALNTRPWSDDALSRLTGAVGKPVRVIASPVSVAAFRQQYPQATGWVGRHGMLAGALLGIGLIVLAMGIPIATLWIHW